MADNDVDEDDTTRHPDAPMRIIVPTEDIFKAFHQSTDNQVFSTDLYEIVTQVIVILLNNTINNVDALNGLPLLDRMTDERFHSDTAFEQKVRLATNTMAWEIYRRVKALGIHYEGIFSYFFDGFVGQDIVLYNFPY